MNAVGNRGCIDAVGAQIVTTGGNATASVPSGVADTVVSAVPGRLCHVLVTTTGTAAAAPGVPIYDNATTHAGTVLFVVPGNAAVGTFYDVQMPAAVGITATNVLNGPVFTVSYY